MNPLIRSISATLIFTLFVGFTSCEFAEEPGILTTEVRELESFEGLVVETIGNIRLYTSGENKVVINTNANVLDDLRTFVSDGKLIIQLTGRHRKIQKLDIEVYTSSYNYLKLNGVANIQGMEGYASERLDIIQDGVGNIALQDISCNQTNITLSDVGNVSLTGTSGTVFCDLEGVGDIELFDLLADTAELRLSGVGDIEVNASESLTIDLSGTGSIFYIGTPEMSINQSGVGKIIQVN